MDLYSTLMWSHL